MFLALMNECSDIGLAHFLVLVKKFLNVVHLIGPIVALAGLVFHLIKLTFSPDNKKNKATIKNWLIAFLMLFLTPYLINATMNLLDDSENFQFAKCWNYAQDNDYSGDSNPDVIVDEKEKKPIVTNKS